MDDRARLIEALLAQPTDALPLLGLADWHEEYDLPHQAALLRLAYALRNVSYPEEAEGVCHAYFVLQSHYRTSTHYLDAARSVGLCGREITPLRSWTWPHCLGWHGAARLPGAAAAYRLWRLVGKSEKAGLPAWNRMVLRCELYSCGVISAQERDREWVTFDRFHRALAIGHPAAHLSWTLRSAGTTIWAMRGGRASGALHVMLAHESAITAPLLAELRLLPRHPTSSSPWAEPRRDCWIRRCEALAIARTYHRDLLRAFHAGEPWVHGKGVYLNLKPKKARLHHP